MDWWTIQGVLHLCPVAEIRKSNFCVHKALKHSKEIFKGVIKIKQGSCIPIKKDCGFTHSIHCCLITGIVKFVLGFMSQHAVTRAPVKPITWKYSVHLHIQDKKARFVRNAEGGGGVTALTSSRDLASCLYSLTSLSWGLHAAFACLNNGLLSAPTSS